MKSATNPATLRGFYWDIWFKVKYIYIYTFLNGVSCEFALLLQ